MENKLNSNNLYQQINKITPILISAKNEECSIKKTLKHIINSIISYRINLKKQIKKTKEIFLYNKLDLMIFPILICDNNSSDKTIKEILKFRKTKHEILVSNKIDILIFKEIAPGKLNSLKYLIRILEEKYEGLYDNVILTDAEIHWSEEVFSHLINYKIINSEKLLIGANIVPKNKKIGFWGEIEILPYYGYGQIKPHGLGRFFKFVSGMCYMAGKDTLTYLKNDIPPNIGNEDVALSLILGEEKIAIVSEAKVYYNTVESLKQFLIIRGRHIRELFRVKRWFIEWNSEKLKIEYLKNNQSIRKKDMIKFSKKRFYSIAEYRSIQFITGFFQSTESFKITKNGIYNWFKNIPAIKLKFFKFIFFILPFALILYFILKLIANLHSLLHIKPGWEPYRNFKASAYNSSFKRSQA